MKWSKLKLDELGRLSPEEFEMAAKPPITLVVDNVRSGHNVGAFFRTMDAFAFEKIILCGISPTPPHKEINKTAIGATHTVNWKYKKSILEAVQTLKAEGYAIVGVEQTQNSIHLEDFSWDGGRLAVIVGNEVNGISEEILPLLDNCLEIPQYGTKHSLNVSVCTGIVLWALRNQMN